MFRARSLPSGLPVLAFAASFQLVPGELAEGARDLVLAFVAAVEVDHRGPLAVVAHAVHQLPEGRPSAGGQGVSGVPEIMEVDSRKPGFAERGQPYPAGSRCDAEAVRPGW